LGKFENPPPQSHIYPEAFSLPRDPDQVMAFAPRKEGHPFSGPPPPKYTTLTSSFHPPYRHFSPFKGIFQTRRPLAGFSCLLDCQISGIENLFFVFPPCPFSVFPPVNETSPCSPPRKYMFSLPSLRILDLQLCHPKC